MSRNAVSQGAWLRHKACHPQWPLRSSKESSYRNVTCSVILLSATPSSRRTPPLLRFSTFSECQGICMPMERKPSPLQRGSAWILFRTCSGGGHVCVHTCRCAHLVPLSGHAGAAYLCVCVCACVCLECDPCSPGGEPSKARVVGRVAGGCGEEQGTGRSHARHPATPAVPPHPRLGPSALPCASPPCRPHKCSAGPWATITRASSSPRWLLRGREQPLPVSSYPRWAP